MRNINEEVDDQRTRAGEGGGVGVDAPELIFHLALCHFSVIPFISSHVSPPASYFVVLFSHRTISSLPPFTEWCDSIHSIHSEILYCIGG